MLFGVWGQANAAADVDQNGIVGSTDLAAVLSRWTN